MMFPIITAVVDQLKTAELDGKDEEGGLDGYDNKTDEHTAAESNEVRLEFREEIDRKEVKRRSAEIKRLSKVFALGVAYASNSGGIATLVGTPPNIILQGVANEKFGKLGIDSGITFANWMAFALPLSIIILFVSWLWLQILFIRCG